MKCPECGGERIKEFCKLCDLFAASKTGMSLGSLNGMQTTTWPMVSRVGLAVMPEQVDEANEALKRHGINCQYDGEGNCHIPDQRAYAKLLRFSGAYNKQEGYSGA